MTENEVFEHISDLAGDYKCFDEKISHRESLILCNLIEEIQKYRAIGTVEEIKMLKDFKELYDAYKLIGTIEEFRQAMRFKEYFMELYDEGLEVANWHKNGDLEPLVNFIDEACS